MVAWKSKQRLRRKSNGMARDHLHGSGEKSDTTWFLDCNPLILSFSLDWNGWTCGCFELTLGPPSLLEVLYNHTHASNHTVNCYKMHLDICIPVAVQVSLCPQLQGQGILLGHIRCCQSLVKGHGQRQTATPTKGINIARHMQVTGTGHLPQCTFECGEAVIPCFLTEGPEKGKNILYHAVQQSMDSLYQVAM